MGRWNAGSERETDRDRPATVDEDGPISTDGNGSVTGATGGTHGDAGTPAPRVPGAGAESATETPPGPDGLPILRNARSLIRDPRWFFEEMSEYGDVVSYGFPGARFCTVLHPDLIERVLVTDAESYGKWGFEQFGGEFASEGLLLTEGEQWRRQRTAVQNAFTLERIRSYGATVAAATEAAVDDWNDGDVLALEEAFSELTLDVLTRSLFDLELDAGREGRVVTRFAEAVNDRGAMDGLSTFVPMWVPTPQNRRYRRALADVRRLVEDLVAERRGRTDEYDDLLASLLTAEDDAGRGMSDVEVRDQLVTFLFAGHETTALALTYAAMEVAKNPGVRERLDAEYRSVLGGDRPTPADLEDLEYTDRVIREILRLYPPAFIVFRRARESVELGGYRIPEGRKLTLPQFHVHTDGRWYDDPSAFDPDRWTDGFEDDLSDYAYFPFGGGPRHCVGMRFAMLELKTVLPTVLQRVEFDLLSDPDPDLSMGATLRPAEPVRVRVRER